MSTGVPNRGKFIVFEGIDGSGKSTQARLLCERLKKEGVPCYETKEPTDKPIGLLLRQYLSGMLKTDERAIAALFAADRLDHVLSKIDGIYDKIINGVNVISDRYYFSSYAYQGDEVPIEWVIEANSQSACALRPDCNIFIDIEPDVAIKRINSGRQHTEIYETQERLTKIKRKYYEAFDLLSECENIVIIDGAGDEASIAEKVWRVASSILKK